MERWLTLDTIRRNIVYACSQRKLSEEDVFNLAAFGFACLNEVPTRNKIGEELDIPQEHLQFIADEIWDDFFTPED
jgi:hypothetical protein